MKLRAAADLGSNTFRLLVAEETSSGIFKEARLIQRVVRAGAGLGSGGAITAEAFLRVEDCLDHFAGELDRLHVNERVAAVTAAGRDLRGGKSIAEAAELKLKAKVIVASGEEEARLSLLGATRLLGREEEGTLLLDIGGGSTEIAASMKGGASHFESLKLGVVRLAEEAGIRAPAGPEGYGELKRRALAAFGKSRFAYLAGDFLESIKSGKALLISNAGTPLTLAALKTGLPPGDTRLLSGVCLSMADVAGAARALSAMDIVDMRRTGRIVPGREDVILAGVAILESFMELLGAIECVVSDGGIAEGLLLSGQADGGAGRFMK